MPPPNLDSKIILITGCSSGFGLLTAVRLAAKGHTVIATMRNLSKQTALVEEASSRGAVVKVMRLDVTDKESINQVAQRIAEDYGYLDILINNAGIGIGGFFEDLLESQIRLNMETNFFGVQSVIRRMIPLMRQRKAGKIINVSSVAGFSGSPCIGAYNASKWALEGFSESLRYELQPFNIDVLLIEPGTYNTPIFHENAQYAENFNNPTSPYFEMSHGLKDMVRMHAISCQKDPELIAQLVEKLINKRKPRFRNFPDAESRIMSILRRILPFRVYSSFVRTALRKHLKK